MDANFLEKFYGRVTEVCMENFCKADLTELLASLLAVDDMPMHCPVHHYIVPAALLTVTRAAQGRSAAALKADLAEALERALEVPGGVCGYSGCCGAAIGAGIFWSIVTSSTPMSEASWGFIQERTAEALLGMAKHGGPRCCKRCSTIAVGGSAAQVRETLKLDLGWTAPTACDYRDRNDDCTKERCPFYKRTEHMV